MHKTYLKSFVFEILVIGDHTSNFYFLDGKVYAGINLTGYPPPGLIPGPLIFSAEIPAPGTAFQCKTLAPGSKKRNKNLHPRA